MASKYVGVGNDCEKYGGKGGSKSGSKGGGGMKGGKKGCSY